MQILSLFGFSILAAATLATSLASVGLHLGTRNQWFHGWITAQSALLGVVIGLSISHDTTHAHTEMQWLPTLCSLAFAAIAYFLCHLPFAYIRHILCRQFLFTNR